MLQCHEFTLPRCGSQARALKKSERPTPSARTVCIRSDGTMTRPDCPILLILAAFYLGNQPEVDCVQCGQTRASLRRPLRHPRPARQTRSSMFSGCDGSSSGWAGPTAAKAPAAAAAAPPRGRSQPPERPSSTAQYCTKSAHSRRATTVAATGGGFSGRSEPSLWRYRRGGEAAAAGDAEARPRLWRPGAADARRRRTGGGRGA